MAKFTNVSKEDMEAFLVPQGFKAMSIEGTTELVYGKRVDHEGMPLSLRVYTGIWPSGESRGVGEDAMWVRLFFKTKEGKIVSLGCSKRVHRVQGWRKNLGNRIDAWQELLPKRMCPECGMPMVERKGTFGAFFGCTGFPVCRHTEKIVKEQHGLATV